MIVGPPQSVHAEDLVAVVRCFQSFGAVHIRGAIEREPLARIRGAATALFAERERRASRGGLSEDVTTQYVRRFLHIDDLRMDDQTAKALLPQAVRAVASTYLGGEARAAPESHVRSILPNRSDTHLPFHQDESILGRTMLNVWIPLSPCGIEAPGLEVVLGSWVEQLAVSPPTDARYAVERAMIDEETVFSRFGPSALWRPVFDLGDAMLFSGRTVHRTYSTPQMMRDRMSVEIRLIASVRRFP